MQYYTQAVKASEVCVRVCHCDKVCVCVTVMGREAKKGDTLLSSATSMLWRHAVEAQ